MIVAAAVAALSLVNVTADNLGYGGVMIATTRAAAERKLGRRLPPTVNPYIPACGEFESITYIGGRMAVIQWSDRTPRATVESIVVALDNHRLDGLPRGLVRRGGAFYPPKNEQVVLWVTDPPQPPLLYIYLVECTD
jgi:hypothetical protein